MATKTSKGTAQASRSIAQLMDLSGRKALVSGGAGYVGSVIAEGLVELGASVGLLDVDFEACQARAQRLCTLRKQSAFAIACDLREEHQTRQAMRDVIRTLQGMDILIHCAAYVGTTERPGWAVPFEQQTVEAWDDAMRVNLTSAFVMVHEAKDVLAASGYGSVIFVASTYGLVGPDLSLYQGTRMANPVGYGASKGGLLQLMRHLATGLAPRVRVNAISPGGIWRNQPEVFHQRYVSRTPLGRMAREEDVKGAVAYLASDLSAYVTGHNLVVDGGWTAW